MPIALPFTQHDGPPAGFFGTVWKSLDYVLVRVETSDGIVGWGDAFAYNALPATRAALDDIIAPMAMGQSADDILGLMDRLGRTLHLMGRSGPVQYALGRAGHRALGHRGQARRSSGASFARRGRAVVDPGLCQPVPDQ